MRLKYAASCSFDCFNIDLKERSDDTVSSIELQRTVYSCGSGALSDKPESACEGCRSEAFKPPADAIRPERLIGSA